VLGYNIGALVLGLIVLLGCAAVVAGSLLYLRSTPVPEMPPELFERRACAKAALARAVAAVPPRPPLLAHDLPALPATVLVEARLFAGDPDQALTHAEQALADHPSDPRAHVLMARTLFFCDQLAGCGAEADKARALGADDPTLDYLECRVEHLQWIRRVHPKNVDVQSSLVPPLVLPFEKVVLKLERHKRLSAKDASVWLTDKASATLSAEEIRLLLSEHYASYYRTLERLLSLAEQDPAFADAQYHAARLALKVGLVEEGRQLLFAIETLMENSLERAPYARDVAHVRSGQLSPDPASLLSIGPKAKRSSRLNILR
jgi:hypothetical protein